MPASRSPCSPAAPRNLTPTDAAVFDTLFATSTRNDEPRSDAAPVRRRSRRPGGGRRRRHAGAGGAASTRRRAARASTPRSSASAPTATACTSPSPNSETMAQPHGSWRWTTPACRPTTSATSTRTAPPPTTATSPRAHATRCVVRATGPDQLAEELHRPHARRLRRARGRGSRSR